MTAPKKLIEVVLLVHEISAESVRDKSIRHGHISTFAPVVGAQAAAGVLRRGLRSLVPDPLDRRLFARL